jgi:hypothetical protein
LEQVEKDSFRVAWPQKIENCQKISMKKKTLDFEDNFSNKNLLDFRKL